MSIIWDTLTANLWSEDYDTIIETIRREGGTRFTLRCISASSRYADIQINNVCGVSNHVKTFVLHRTKGRDYMEELLTKLKESSYNIDIQNILSYKSGIKLKRSGYYYLLLSLYS